MTTLNELAEQAEAANAEQQHEMLAQAWEAIHGWPLRLSAGLDAKRFLLMLDCGAFESAAMTLVPEGDGICLNMGQGPWVGHFARIWEVSAELAVGGKDACAWEVHGCNPNSLSLALTAAALRARGSSHDDA
jgi:hypothetical protein